MQKLNTDSKINKNRTNKNSSNGIENNLGHCLSVHYKMPVIILFFLNFSYIFVLMTIRKQKARIKSWIACCRQGVTCPEFYTRSHDSGVNHMSMAFPEAKCELSLSLSTSPIGGTMLVTTQQVFG